MRTKEWYESKAIWSGIALMVTAVGTGMSQLIEGNFDLGVVATMFFNGAGLAGLRFAIN